MDDGDRRHLRNNMLNRIDIRPREFVVFHTLCILLNLMMVNKIIPAIVSRCFVEEAEEILRSALEYGSQTLKQVTNVTIFLNKPMFELSSSLSQVGLHSLHHIATIGNHNVGE